jgi:enterochelin esterase-like enzyme
MPLLRTVLLLLLIIGALRAESWNNPPGNLPKNVQHHTFMSASMKTAVGYNIYLPEDYAKDPAHAYPVLYYLHGRGGNENDNMGSFGLFDAAIHDQKIPPFIYVHAMCGSQSGYVDAPDGSVMGETVFIKELIPHIDATYRTLPFKGARAIEGFSKGGQGALLFAYKFPELFSSAIGYAAGLASGAELKRELPAVFKQMHNDDVAQFDATSAWHFARANADQLKTGIGIWLVLGDQDPHFDRNRRMDALLTELAIPHEYHILPGIGHDTGRVYHDVGVDGFIWHSKLFDLKPPQAVKKK